jgi:hypothetical protein
VSNRIVYVNRASDLPTVEHYAIITTSSHSDGYDGSSNHVEYKAYFNREEWEADIAQLTNGFYRQEFRAMHVKPASISVQVKVS